MISNAISRLTDKRLCIALLIFLLTQQSHAADIVLTGDEIFKIENTTYSNKGNIKLYDNSQLTIRNSTFNLEQDYHEQFQIILHDNSTLTIENNSVLTSSQRFLVPLFQNSQATVDHSTALNNASLWKRGAIFQPNDNSTFTSNYSNLDAVGDMFSYSGSSLANIYIQNSSLQALAFHFPLNSSVNIHNIKLGLIQDFQILKSETNLPYNMTILNSTIEREINAWTKDNAQATFTNCEFHQIAMDEKASVSIVDSSVGQLVPRFIGVNVTLEALARGHVESLTLDLSDSNSYILNVTNSYIGGYYIRIHSGSDIQINNSHITVLRPDGDSITKINNCTIDEVWFWSFTGIIDFTDSIIGNWADTRSDDFITSNFLFKGTVMINKADLINMLMGNQWRDTIVRREFPCRVQADNPSSANIEVRKPNGIIAYTGHPNQNGDITTGEIIFDSTNYDKPWKIYLMYNSQVLDEHELIIASSTPILLSTTVPLPKKIEPTSGIQLLLLDE